jgi:hypothetical protein
MNGITNVVKNEIKEYFILYFDILGYKDVFDDDSDIYQFLRTLNEVVKETKTNLESANHVLSYKIKMFSDNFIIGFECNNNIDDKQYLIHICLIAGNIQLLLLKNHNILIRGGLTKGQLHFNDDFVFGKGLIDAFKLENTAEYPRILIDEQVSKYYFETEKQIPYGYKIDEDGNYFVDYLFDISLNELYDDSSENEIKEINNALIKIMKNKSSYPKNYTRSSAVLSREKIIRKYLWVLGYHNTYYATINRKELLVKYQIVINKRLLRPEISFI